MRSRRRTRNVVLPATGLLLTLVLLPLVTYLLIEGLRKPSTFHIVADTEVLDMVTTGVSATRWYVEQADAILGNADPLAEQSSDSFAFSGLVEIGPRSNVRMVRYGDGTLQITLQESEASNLQLPGTLSHARGGVPQRKLHREEEEQLSRAIPVVTLENLLTEGASGHWGDSALFQVYLEELPFSGSLLAVGSIGSETYAASIGEPPPVLRAGRVIVMEKRFFSDLRYPVMELDLQLGDEAWVINEKGDPADTACVFSIAALDSSGIGVACHATGKTLLVSRFGGHVVKMEPGPLDMIVAEPTLQIMIPLLFSLIYILIQWLLGLMLYRHHFPLFRRRNIKGLLRHIIAIGTRRS